MEKLTLLAQLYAPEQRPVAVFGKNLRSLWINDAFAHRFPNLAEGADLRSAYPGLSLEHLESGAAPAQILQDQEGAGKLFVTAYPGDPHLFAGVWEDGERFIPAAEGISPEGVRLMDAWLRQNVFRIFTHLDRLGEYLEKAGLPQCEEDLERIENRCQQILRLGMVLSGCYGPDDSRLPVPVEMDDFFETLFREADFRLAPLGIVLERAGSSRGAVCMLDRRWFSCAILCLIDLSAGQMPEGGSMRFEISRTVRELCIQFSDQTTSFSRVSGTEKEVAAINGQLEQDGGFSRLLGALLERVIRESGGRCLMGSGKSGLRVSIRLPLAADAPPHVDDQPSYTVRYRKQARSSLSSVLLSDLPQ